MQHTSYSALCRVCAQSLRVFMHFALAACKALALPAAAKQVSGVELCCSSTFTCISNRSEQCQRTTSQRAAHFSQRRGKRQPAAAPLSKMTST